MAVEVKNVSVARGNLLDKFYVVAVFKGLMITLRHMFKKKVTIQYPDEKKVMPAAYRGLHMLTKDEEGRVKCVACEMCSTACPANCIRIVAADGDWQDSREKYPEVYEIDLLRCIFCGMCVEACPEDAIDMTDLHTMADYTREDFIYDKDRLLKVYDEFVSVHPEKANRADGVRMIRNASVFPDPKKLAVED